MSEENTAPADVGSVAKLLDLEGMMARAFERTNSIGDEAQRNFVAGLMLGFARGEVKRVIDAMEHKSADAYQVIGALLADSNANFDSPAGQRALDYFADGALVEDDFLPWHLAEDKRDGSKG